MVKILVVDDDEDLLEMVTMMLRASNMQVIPLNAGALVKEALQNERPDFLLMDIFLGDSDGRQLCKELKEPDNYPQLPVFLYSAGEISSASIVASNADFFLRKPFNMTQLVDRIHEYLKKELKNS